MTVPYQNYASDTDTNFNKVLTDMNTEITAPGDGSASSKPQKILFFVSDGVADAAGVSCQKNTTAGQDPKTGTNYTRCQEPLNVSYCTTIKNRGIKIAVLYTTYLALPTNGWYMSWIDPFNKGPYGPSPNSEIAKNMEACASPGFYFEVSPTDGIADAMKALFQKAYQSARISEVRTSLIITGAFGHRFAERLKQRAVDRIALRVVFGVPLRAKRKALARRRCGSLRWCRRRPRLRP